MSSNLPRLASFLLSLGVIAVLPLHAQAPQAPQAPTPDLSDPEVAHVAVTANSIDIDLARFIQSRTRTAEVRQFADIMIATHTGVNQQAAALAQRLGVTPQDNGVSQSLMSGAKDARAALDRLQPGSTALDRAYMDREVAYHQAVLDALDGLLIPTSSNPELRKLLQDVHPVIAAHLEHAKRLTVVLNPRAAR